MSGDWDAFFTRRRTGRRGSLVRRRRSSMPACRRIPGRDPRSTNFRRRFVPRSSAAAMLLALAATFATGAVADPPPSRSLRAARRIGEIRIDRRTAYHFGVYAAGQQVDGMHFNDDDYTSDWDAAWESAVATTPSGWSVEMRIPLRVLRVPEGARAFGLNVARTLTRRHEETTWQYRPREAAGVVSGFGLLTGLDGLRPVVQLDLKPYVAGRGNCGTATATPCQAGFDLGLDARYSLTSELALVGTVHPDFGQVEIDERVLNLTTFESYLQEKCTFFHEWLVLFILQF